MRGKSEQGEGLKFCEVNAGVMQWHKYLAACGTDKLHHCQ